MAKNKDGFLSKEEARERESSGTLEDRVSALEVRVSRIENERIYAANNQFEIWVDNKVRGYEYGPDLKKIVMPQGVGKTVEESRKIFYVERDKLVKERYPGRPTPLWV